MNSLKLQLDEFFLTKMIVVWHPPARPMQVTSEFSFGYEVERHKTDTNKFRFSFTMRAKPKQQKSPAGYEIECNILGLFSFVEGTTEEEMQQLIRINGSTVLYGILRGQIATLTGSFPGGKFTLPTVMMHEIVQVVEAQKAKQAKKSKDAYAAEKKHPPVAAV